MRWPVTSSNRASSCSSLHPRMDPTQTSFASPMGLRTWSRGRVPAPSRSALGTATPQSADSVPTTWARTSWTVHPGRQLGVVHCPGVRERQKLTMASNSPRSRPTVRSRSTMVATRPTVVLAARPQAPHAEAGAPRLREPSGVDSHVSEGGQSPPGSTKQQ